MTAFWAWFFVLLGATFGWTLCCILTVGSENDTTVEKQESRR